MKRRKDNPYRPVAVGLRVPAAPARTSTDPVVAGTNPPALFQKRQRGLAQQPQPYIGIPHPLFPPTPTNRPAVHTEVPAYPASFHQRPVLYLFRHSFRDPLGQHRPSRQQIRRHSITTKVGHLPGGSRTSCISFWRNPKRCRISASPSKITRPGNGSCNSSNFSPPHLRPASLALLHFLWQPHPDHPPL